MLEETNLHLMRTSNNDIRRGNMGIHDSCKEQASSRTHKGGKEYVKHNIPDRKTDIWVRENTQVTYMIEQVR